jgi:hypothetical protein
MIGGAASIWSGQAAAHAENATLIGDSICT